MHLQCQCVSIKNVKAPEHFCNKFHETLFPNEEEIIECCPMFESILNFLSFIRGAIIYHPQF